MTEEQQSKQQRTGNAEEMGVELPDFLKVLGVQAKDVFVVDMRETPEDLGQVLLNGPDGYKPYGFKPIIPPGNIYITPAARAATIVEAFRLIDGGNTPAEAIMSHFYEYLSKISHAKATDEEIDFVRVVESVAMTITRMQLDMFFTGNWGACDKHDTIVNNDAANRGGSILAVYPMIRTKERIWIQSSTSRTQTTVMIPDDY